jgi:membrane protease YdiL (CAAX protease family)
MPPEVAEKMERAGRYMLFLIDALVAGLVLELMRRHSVSIAQVGLRLENWKSHLLLGLAAGILWVALQRALMHLLRGAKQSSITDYYRKGSALFWLFSFLVGTFTEEFWRAFCLFSFNTGGHSLGQSVILTAIAFGAGHLRFRWAGALGAATLGGALALLYVWQGSLLSTYCAHLVANLGGLYYIRRALPRK